MSNYISFIIGALIGSFLNVCIYHISKGKPISFPYLYCPKCETELKPIDFIPIISHVFSKCKCRYCGERVFIQYPIVELLNGLIYVLLYLKLGVTVYFFKYAILSSLLIVISFIDIKFHIIPDKLNLFCIGVGVFFSLYHFSKWTIINSAIGLFVGGGLFLLIAVVTKGGMGGGDIKLMGALGLCLGWQYIVLTTVLSFVIGAIIAIFLLALKLKGRKDYIPYGPFISIAAIVTMVYGVDIIELYVKMYIS